MKAKIMEGSIATKEMIVEPTIEPRMTEKSKVEIMDWEPIVWVNLSEQAATI